MEQKYEAKDLEVHYHGQQEPDIPAYNAAIDQAMVESVCRRLYLVIGIIAGVVAMLIIAVVFMAVLAVHLHDDVVTIAIEVARHSNK